MKDFGAVSSIRQPNLDEKAYHIIKDLVLNRNLAPGEKLNENELARALEISRTPIREALRRLEGEGLVEIVPRRGVFVTRIRMSDVVEIYDLRKLLEGFAARRAAELQEATRIKQLKEVLAEYKAVVNGGDHAEIIKVDNCFHRTLAQASNNSRLGQMLDSIRGQLGILKTRSVTILGRAERSYLQKEQVVDAIVAGRADEAEKLMIAHLEDVKQELLQALQADQTRALLW